LGRELIGIFSRALNVVGMRANQKDRSTGIVVGQAFQLMHPISNTLKLRIDHREHNEID
jgi:hypothetical protein